MAAARGTLQEMPQSWQREGDFTVAPEEIMLFAQLGKLLDVIRLKSKTEGRHYLLLRICLCHYFNIS